MDKDWLWAIYIFKELDFSNSHVYASFLLNFLCPANIRWVYVNILNTRVKSFGVGRIEIQTPKIKHNKNWKCYFHSYAAGMAYEAAEKYCIDSTCNAKQC